MKISVIIPTYNRKDFVLKAIDSVQNQSVKADEIIVVDDGSNDGTKEALESLHVKYIHKSNGGVSSARNEGIMTAKNDWIAFLDSDDLWHKDKLKEQIRFHEQNPHILFSHTDELWIFKEKEVKQKKHQLKPSGKCFLDNISFCKIGPSTTLLHKSIFEDVGVFDEELKLCEDFDLWLRVLQKYELGYLDQKLISKIAGHDDQLSFSTFGLDFYRVKALLKHLNSPYKDEVKKEIEKKSSIQLKGAIKHDNQELVTFYSQVLQSI